MQTHRGPVLTVVFRPAAAADIEEAYLWYRDKAEDLSTDFLAAVQEAVDCPQWPWPQPPVLDVTSGIIYRHAGHTRG